MSTFSVIVDNISRQGEGSLAFTLVAATGDELPAFTAGAHIDVHLPGGLIRQYSIASGNAQRGHYVICVKKAEASRGGSLYMHDSLRVGDKLPISNPRNLFPLQPAERYLLLAGGIGITPLLSMAEQLTKQQLPFELHYYAASQTRAAFVQRLAQGFNGGSVSLWCSDQGQSIRQQLPAALQQPRADTHVYLCGPAGFMAHITQVSQGLGWQTAQLHSEAFAPSTAFAAQGSAGSFSVALAHSGRHFTVPVDKTIAQVLLENQVPVPLSCEMGICGACLTPVVQGRPEHRDSVQSDVEKNAPAQQIALCCSRSLSPTLVLDM